MVDTLQLGGNIELTGFSELEPAVMIVVKKIVGNYAKRVSNLVENFEQLHITLKEVHKSEKSQRFELHAKVLAGGQVYAAETTDINLFVTMDKVLKKVENEIQK